MAASPSQLTSYFRAVQTLNNLEDRRFTSQVPFRRVSSDEIASGQLGENTTEELFGLTSTKRTKPLDLVISFATLHSDDQAEGLVLIAAQLHPDGHLSADLASHKPWIPASRLRGPGIEDRQLMVGTLANFWAWRRGEGTEIISRAAGWTDVIAYAEAMIDEVIDEDLLAAGLAGEREATIHRPGPEPHPCWITPGTVVNANSWILDLYRYLEDNPTPELYQRLLTSDRDGRITEDTIDDHPDMLLRSALRATGSMSNQHPLTASQRRALHAFLEDDDGDVTAVSGPPGTGKTTLLQSVVASLIVTHSLRDDPAPLIVGTSTNNQAVTNIIDSFSSVTRADAGLLARRWLPVAAKDGATDTPLCALAAYAPSTAKVQQAQSKGYLLEDIRKDGVYTNYSAPGYVEAATAHFLAEIAAYAESIGCDAPEDLEAAEDVLADAVRLCDQRREELLRARHRTDATVSGSSWPRRSWAIGSPHITDAAGVTGGLDTEQENAQYLYVDKGQTALHDLARLCLLTTEQVDTLRAADSLRELDRALDVTVRHAQFWLAVHRYEARWLRVCTSENFIAPEERRRTTSRYMERYWPQATSLTPCFVMTTYQLPKYFRLWTKPGEKSAYDLARADLLIVDEAGQVDVSLGACAFALAKRALVVGDVKQLAPIWGIDSESDRIMGESFDLGPEWETLEHSGLTASERSSVMLAATSASKWCYGPDDDNGLFLAEHFRCRSEIIEYCNQLIYKGQLVPSRPRTGYALDGLVPHPFLFREVAHSEDQRRGSSRVNLAEAEAIAAWLAEHWEYFYEVYGVTEGAETEKSVFGIVTPFAAQAREVRRILARKLGRQRAQLVTVGTAHSLQGAERRIVLFSSVYGDNSGQATFINSTLELMNVAVSRAQDLFIVFGARSRWTDNGPVFSLLRRMAVKDECYFLPWGEDPREAGSASSDPAKADAGALVAGSMLALWRDQGAVSRDRKLTARKLNQALQEHGFIISKTPRGWEPTAKGTKLGILGYSGRRNGETFLNVKYSPAAQAALLHMITSGDLPL